MGAFTMRIDHNIVDVQKMLSDVEKDIKDKAIIPAVNKTADVVKGRVVKRLADEIGSQQKVIRKQIVVKKAHKGGGRRRSRFYATVDATEARAVNLIEFVDRSKRKTGYFNQKLSRGRGKNKTKGYRSSGVTAKAWGTKKTYKGTFIGTSGKGDLRVYRRTSKARNKITLVSGGSPRKVFSRPETFAFMRKVVAERFPIEFEAKVNHILKRMKK